MNFDQNAHPLFGLWAFVPSSLKAKILHFWSRIPFGNLCTVKQGACKMHLRKDLIVLVTNGRSQDALPVSLVSQQLVDAFYARMVLLGYPSAAGGA